MKTIRRTLLLLAMVATLPSIARIP